MLRRVLVTVLLLVLVLPTFANAQEGGAGKSTSWEEVKKQLQQTPPTAESAKPLPPSAEGKRPLDPRDLSRRDPGVVIMGDTPNDTSCMGSSAWTSLTVGTNTTIYNTYDWDENYWAYNLNGNASIKQFDICGGRAEIKLSASHYTSGNGYVRNGRWLAVNGSGSRSVIIGFQGNYKYLLLRGHSSDTACLKLDLVVATAAGTVFARRNIFDRCHNSIGTSVTSSTDYNEGISVTLGAGQQYIFYLESTGNAVDNTFDSTNAGVDALSAGSYNLYWDSMSVAWQ